MIAVMSVVEPAPSRVGLESELRERERALAGSAGFRGLEISPFGAGGGFIVLERWDSETHLRACGERLGAPPAPSAAA